MGVLAFFALLAAAIAYGVIYDVGSYPTGVEKRGVIIEARAAQSAFRPLSFLAPRATARLEDGRNVDLRLPAQSKLAAGDALTLVEMQSPWGATWDAPK